jgi:DNA modification methylase
VLRELKIHTILHKKPLRVLEHIIRIATDEGDLVFDPFMGVGSTGVASLRLKRKFIGIEIDPAYFEAAYERIREAEAEQKRRML